MNNDVAVQECLFEETPGPEPRLGPERETQDSVALVFPSSSGQPHTPTRL